MLYGDIGDGTYGRIVGDLLPDFLSGAFAAAIAAAVLTTFNSILNASAALWVVDIHKTYIDKNPNVRRLSLWVSVVMVLLAFAMIPIFKEWFSVKARNGTPKLFSLALKRLR